MPDPADYELAIDAQADKLVESRQKLLYFLMSGSFVIIAFNGKFIADNLHGQFPAPIKTVDIVLASISSVSGVVAAGVALLSLHFGSKSLSLHLKYRYARRTYPSLTPDEQTEWDKVNEHAVYFLHACYVALFLEIAFTVAFFIHLSTS